MSMDNLRCWSCGTTLEEQINSRDELRLTCPDCHNFYEGQELIVLMLQVIASELQGISRAVAPLQWNEP